MRACEGRWLSLTERLSCIEVHALGRSEHGSDQVPNAANQIICGMFTIRVRQRPRSSLGGSLQLPKRLGGTNVLSQGLCEVSQLFGVARPDRRLRWGDIADG